MAAIENNRNFRLSHFTLSRNFTLSPIKGYLIPDKKKKADLVHKDD